jgi:hypothetical protein
MAQIALNKERLALRQLIVQELEVIKEEKRKSHLQYLTYF